MLCTACPAVVDLVRLYYPDLTDWLLPLTSPMVAHGRDLQRRFPGSATVFIGPCTAKKAEAESQASDFIHAVLTFEELNDWLADANIKLDQLEESPFDGQDPGPAAFFPLSGGLLHAAGIAANTLSAQHQLVSGVDALRHTLEGLRQSPRPILIEALYCEQGCIGGPGAPCPLPSTERRARLLDYANSCSPTAPQLPKELAQIQHQSARPPALAFNESQIQQVLVDTGKGSPADRLDCGACGYPSCRDKAIAVLSGLAVKEMCLPLMRRLAEQRSDRIIDTSPNGIVMLDKQLTILAMNPAFRSYFYCSDATIGRKISALMDPEPFEHVATGATDKIELTTTHAAYQLQCHQIIYSLPEEGQIVGIFVDITKGKRHQEALHALRSRTIQQAEDLLQHQLSMAQDLARLLGESTGKSEALLRDLIQLAKTPKERGE